MDSLRTMAADTIQHVSPGSPYASQSHDARFTSCRLRAEAPLSHANAAASYFTAPVCY
jgi:hypothetical protein